MIKGSQADNYYNLPIQHKDKVFIPDIFNCNLSVINFSNYLKNFDSMHNIMTILSCDHNIGFDKNHRYSFV